MVALLIQSAACYPVAVLTARAVVFDEAQSRRVPKNYAAYCNRFRTHLALAKDAPDFRRLRKRGPIAAISILGGAASSIRPGLAFD